MNTPVQYWQRIYDSQQANWWWRGRHLLVRSLLKRFGTSRSAGRMLDIGCGPGFVLAMLDTFSRGFGLDCAEGPLIYGASKGMKRLTRASAEFMPFKGDVFDGIVALDSLEHMSDDTRALTECGRVMKRGAFLLLMVPAYPWLWTRRDASFGHYRRYTTARLRGILNAAGFEAVKVTHFNCLLLLPLIIARCAENLARVPLGLADEGVQVVSPVVGRLLDWLQGLECRLAAGRGLPVGTTLACVARKVSDGCEEK